MIRIIFAAAMPLALAACTASGRPADPMPDNSPVDPGLGLHSSYHQAVLDGYTHRVAVEPKPWRQQNDSQAPGAGAGS